VSIWSEKYRQHLAGRHWAHLGCWAIRRGELPRFEAGVFGAVEVPDLLARVLVVFFMSLYIVKTPSTLKRELREITTSFLDSA
jgi:hypothetical protein